MKKSLLLIALSAGMLTFSCQQKSEEIKEHQEEVVKAEEVQQTSRGVVGEAEVIPGNYGDIVVVDNITSTSELVSQVEANGQFTGKVLGEIKEVCTKKGCFFSMELPSGELMRVTFKDYGFFLPTNSQGFPIVIEGIATVTETDVKTLRHYAEDKGKSKEEIEAITEPERKITFEATGALIKAKA